MAPVRRGSCRCPFLNHSALRRNVGEPTSPSASVRRVRSTSGGRASTRAALAGSEAAKRCERQMWSGPISSSEDWFSAEDRKSAKAMIRSRSERRQVLEVPLAPTDQEPLEEAVPGRCEVKVNSLRVELEVENLSH